MGIYHALNRGVEKRDLFLDDKDRVRFIHDLYEFNDTAPAGNSYKSFQNMEIRAPYFSRERDPIVDIHGWVLMGNHYHLLLSERRENGISDFLRKLNVGYAMYFNERYERSGTLFQGRTKKILIKSDAHFLHILHYIHFNPLDFENGSKDWRSGKVANAAAALKFLREYRWSSYLDYCGSKNFPSVVTTELFADIFKNYERSVRGYLREIAKDPLGAAYLE